MMAHYTGVSSRRETEGVGGEQHVSFVLGGRHLRVERATGLAFFRCAVVHLTDSVVFDSLTISSV